MHLRIVFATAAIVCELGLGLFQSLIIAPDGGTRVGSVSKTPYSHATRVHRVASLLDGRSFLQSREYCTAKARKTWCRRISQLSGCGCWTERAVLSAWSWGAPTPSSTRELLKRSSLEKLVPPASFQTRSTGSGKSRDASRVVSLSDGHTNQNLTTVVFVKIWSLLKKTVRILGQHREDERCTRSG